MPLRFRRSIKLGPGVRLNFNKKSIGITAGRKGMRYTVNTSGRATRTIGLPGTGLWSASSSTIGGSRQLPRSRQPASATPPTAKALPRPGLLAPGVEKRFHEGVQAYLRGEMAKALQAFEVSSSGDSHNASDDLFAGLSAHKIGDNDKAVRYLERVVEGNIELPDALMNKYLPSNIVEMNLSVSITPFVSAILPVSSLGACLLLAEIYQSVGRLEDAIGLLQQLHEENPGELPLRVALCDLLYEDGDFDGVVAISAGIENESDLSLACLLLRGQALARRGLRDGALSVFTTALKKTSGRNGQLLKEIRYERAVAYEAAEKGAAARKDFERIFAADPAFRDVSARLGIAAPARPKPISVPDVADDVCTKCGTTRPTAKDKYCRACGNKW